jgi:serpin B
LINDLIGPDVITGLTRLVLVSAIHFKGTWAHPFKEKATEKSDFIGLGGKKTVVKMMSQVTSLRSGSVKDFAGLALPYAGGHMSMVLLLPKGDSSNIHALASDGETLALAAQNYSNWHETKTHVKLPKFKIEYSMDACDAMKQLGATDLFDERSLDLSNMLKEGKGHGLYVSAICHKAFVDVNEEGTEAAAATAVVMALRGRPAAPPEFFCNRPFVFLICTGKTILFVGKVMKLEG